MSRSTNELNHGNKKCRKVRRRVKRIQNHVSRTETMKEEAERQFLEYIAVRAECEKELERMVSNENQ